MENRLCLKSKQREDRTDQEETTDASSHIRHSVAIPYPVPQKNLTVQVNKISIIVKQCFAAVRFILQWNRLFVCARLYNIVTQGWYFDWQFAPSSYSNFNLLPEQITFSLFETEVMLLAIVVNSQYSNMKNRLLRQQIEIWIATCSEQTFDQNTNIAWQYRKVAHKRTTGFTVKAVPWVTNENN